MIGSEHERAMTGAGADFMDVVAVDFCDPDQGLSGLAWITRLPNAGRTRANALLFSEGRLIEQLELPDEGPVDDWREARVDGVRMSTAEPLERWSLEVSGADASLQLEVEAFSGPRELGEQMPADTIGVERYEQLCKLNGTVEAQGRVYPVSCFGRRVHSWGEFAWHSIDRWRTLYAVSDAGHAISVAAALPSGGAGHGDELKAALLLDNAEQQSFDDVRLSTVFGSDGLPTKAGLELWVAGDELPRRLGGEAICGARSQGPDHELFVTFFRWSMEGVPAYGCYELVSRA